MREPEFYRIKRTGVRFDPDGVELKNADGRYRRYYGITPEQLAQAKADGWARKSAALTSCHTWDDWGMFLTDVEITEPEVEVNTATVPGRHGVLDYSEALTGAPVYHNRTITLTLLKCGKMAWWHEEYSRLLELLHGKVTKLYFGSLVSRIAALEEGAAVDLTPYAKTVYVDEKVQELSDSLTHTLQEHTQSIASLEALVGDIQTALADIVEVAE